MADDQDDFLSALEYSKTVLNVSDFKYKQVEAIRSLYDGNDSIIILPTGYGKSLIFQCLPWLFQKKYGLQCPMITIVVTPLNSIMEDQVRSLCEKGIPACYINIQGTSVTTYKYNRELLSDDEDEDDDDVGLKTNVPVDDIAAGKYNIIYTHPEALLDNKQIYKILQSTCIQEALCCTVIDEVHMVTEWGKDFRKAFSKLGELTCLFPSVPHAAFTATATKDVIKKLGQMLQLKSPVLITECPDRPNIYLELRNSLPNRNKYLKYDEILGSFREELKHLKEKFPVTIMYVDNLGCLGYCYNALASDLGSDGYKNFVKLPENRIFGQFHKDYTSKMKELIISELRKENPILRLVLATVALGMGLNAPSIERIVHFRPPTTIEQYMQEIGRAGRNGKHSLAILYFNKNDIASNRKGLEKSVVNYCNTTTCLREVLMSHFGFGDFVRKCDKEQCCVNCSKD